MNRQHMRLIAFFGPFALGYVAIIGSLWLGLAPPVANSELIGKETSASLVLQSEEWLGMPLKYLTTFEPLWMRRFIERQQVLEGALKGLSRRSEGLSRTAKKGVETISVISQAGLQLTTTPRGELEKAATDFEIKGNNYRDAIRDVVVQIEQHDAALIRQDEHARELNLLAAVASVVFTTCWAAAGLWMARKLRLQSFGGIVHLAGRDAVPDQIVSSPKCATLHEVEDAVTSLAKRLAEQRRSTQFQIQQQDMLRDFTEALETTDDEGEILQLFHRMLELRHPAHTIEVFLTDPSEAELRPTFGEVNPSNACVPGGPARCKALRMGRALRVNDPTSMMTCPRLPPGANCNYACIPLTIGGRSSSAIRILSSSEQITVSDVLDISTVAQRFAVRLGVLRLLATTSRQARTDALTGIANRRVLLDSLSLAVGQMRTSEKAGMVAVLALDLDHFKRLNDTYGHAAGDTALRRFVTAVRGVLPEDGMLGRTGGEEFVAFRPVASVSAGMELANRILETVRELTKAGNAPATTVSIGVAFAPQDGDSVEEALAVADERLYQAKEQGRDRAVGPPALSVTRAA